MDTSGPGRPPTGTTVVPRRRLPIRTARQRLEVDRVRRPPVPATQIALLATAGVLLNVLVLLVAVHVVRGATDVDRRATGIVEAQRAFQDADMMHDALRADVLAALAVASGTVDRADDDPAASAREHAQRYRADLVRVASVRLPPADVDALARLRPQQEAYAERSLQLTSGQLELPALLAALPDFRRRFAGLERDQAAATDRLTALERRTSLEGGRQQVRSEDLTALAAVGGLVGVLVLAAWLTRQGRDLGRALADERDIATTLQDAMLPATLPVLPGVEVAARYLPAAPGTQVGGDWYDVFRLPEGRIGVVVGDVVGHDMRAASVMGQVRNALRAYAHEGIGPGQVLTRLNDLCVEHGPDHAASCVLAVVDPAAATLTLAAAGHHPPVLRGEDGRAVLVDVPARPPLAVVPRVTYGQVVLPLPRGGLLLLYTGGLVERRDDGLEPAVARLLASVEAVRGEDPAVICSAVLADVLQTPPQDDVVVLAVALAAELGPRLELEVAAVPASLADVRRALSRWLDEAGAEEVEAYEILVAVGEATSNAVEHAYGPGGARSVRVACTRDDALVRIEVADDGQWREARGRDRGRGLGLMRGLMEDVVVKTDATGTRVGMSRVLVGVQ